MPRREFGQTEVQQTPSYIPSPTAEEFIWATREGPINELRVLILMGPRGEGKTSGAIGACLALAERVGQESPALLPLIVGVVRDTAVNLKRTTLVTFREFERKKLRITWQDDEREALVGDPGHPSLHFHFFGVDKMQDSDKFQGLTMAVLWLEEVAPAADLSAGIPVETFGLGVTSIRQRGVPKRCLVTMNPPDEDAWILRVERELLDADKPSTRIRRWEMPPGEKERHFRSLATRATDEQESRDWETAAEEFRAYREWCEAALVAIGRRDLANRLVGGQIGEIKVGEPVVSTFVRRLHVVDALEPVGMGAIIRGHDGGGSPTTVICQALGADGRDGLNILASHTSVNTPLEQHIRDWVMPTMQRRGLLPLQRAKGAYSGLVRRMWTYRDIGDPSMLWEGGTVKAENTSGRVIQEMLGAALEPGPVDWDSRREALNAAFLRPGGGERARFIEIDGRDNTLLIQALAGRFRYPKDMASGRITMTVEAAKRVSGPKFTGGPDALAYVLATLYPAAEWLRQTLRRPVPKPPRPRSWLGA